MSTPPTEPGLHDPDFDGPGPESKPGEDQPPAAPSMPPWVSCLGIGCIAFLGLFGFCGTCVPLGLVTLDIRIDGKLTPGEQRREDRKFCPMVAISGCVALIVIYWVARL